MQISALLIAVSSTMFHSLKDKTRLFYKKLICCHGNNNCYELCLKTYVINALDRIMIFWSYFSQYDVTVALRLLFLSLGNKTEIL